MASTSDYTLGLETPPHGSGSKHDSSSSVQPSQLLQSTELYPWVKVKTDPGVYTRPCFGQEHSASFNQNVCDGHTELSMVLTFRTNIEQDDLVARARQAWRSMRNIHPECAIELTQGKERPQRMSYVDYSLGNRGSEEAEWLRETFVVEQATPSRTWKDVCEVTYNRKLPSKGKRAMLYLVLPPEKTEAAPADGGEDGEFCFIYNVAHAVTDGFSFVIFYNSLLKALMDTPSAEQSNRRSMLPTRLPDSVLPTYVRRYNPKEGDLKQSLGIATAQLKLYQHKVRARRNTLLADFTDLLTSMICQIDDSVALWPHQDYRSRAHKTVCLVSRLEQSDSEATLAALKHKHGRLSVTYLGAAATILSIYSIYGRGTEKGALLGMTRNARRWIDTEKGEAAIPMATDVVFLWVAFDGVELPQHGALPSTESLVSLAIKVREALAPHLVSPHYIASIAVMSEAFVDSLDAASQVSENAEVVGPQAPGFSPGGAWPVASHFKSADGSLWLKRSWLYQYGRQIGTSPWISMCSIDGRLCLHCGFDERYHEKAMMDALVSRTRSFIELVGRP